MKNVHYADDQQSQAARHAAAEELVPQIHRTRVEFITRARFTLISLLEAGAALQEAGELLGPDVATFAKEELGLTPDETNLLIRFSQECDISRDALHGEVPLPRLCELLALLGTARVEIPVADAPAGSGTTASERPAPLVTDHDTQPASPHAADNPSVVRKESAAPQAVGAGGAKGDRDKAFDWIDDFFGADEDPAACQA